ncbi:MAG TPA: hypothetical protein VNK04_24590 [Gemmataceae bacterium]|nr:hypothetical protein [Gemmataceae bacterium]
MAPSSGGAYRVVYSEAVRERLRQLGEKARQAGLIERYAEALRVIEERLANRPLEWGDPLYSFPQLKLLICRGLYWVFAVEYAVHEGQRVVFLREYRLLPRNPLEP